MPNDERRSWRSTHLSVSADAIGDLPAVRSRVSPCPRLTRQLGTRRDLVLPRPAVATSSCTRRPCRSWEVAWVEYRPRIEGPLGDWLVDPASGASSLHEARRHMRGDLERYAYLAYMAGRGKFPKVMDLPAHLMPNHRNAHGPMRPLRTGSGSSRGDRRARPSSPHREGRPLLHPSRPDQMRSLTVRRRLACRPSRTTTCSSETAPSSTTKWATRFRRCLRARSARSFMNSWLRRCCPEARALQSLVSRTHLQHRG